MPERLRLIAAVALLGYGLLAVGVGAGANLIAWYTAWSYARSGEAERMQRQIEEASADDDAAGSRTYAPGGYAIIRPTAESAPTGTPALSRGETRSGLAGPPGEDRAEALSQAQSSPLNPTAQPRASAAEIELVRVDFEFDSPPENGAQARLEVELRSHAAGPSDPIGVAVSSRWFDGYRVVGAIPAVVEDRVEPDGSRHFDFPGLQPAASDIFELYLTATTDNPTPPDVRVVLAGGDEIGQAHPQTGGVPPRVGRARALKIPSLDLRAAVVQTAWEPPAFVIGQLRASADLGQGNSVLIGHLGGLAGNVFAQLDHLKVGEEVIAVSGGEEHRFVISEIEVRPNTDSSPTLPTDRPRLTLMTCTGTWNPFTRDYSDRLWVIAEPPELAEATIAAVAARAAAATAEPTSAPAATPSAVAAATPAPVAAPAAVEPARPGGTGLKITAPVKDARVPARVVVRGTRTSPIDPSRHVWLLVRARVVGSHWYAYPKPIEARPDGAWQAEVALGGRPRLHHDLRVGTVDDATNSALLRQVADHPGAPLPELPKGFATEARVIVRRG